MTITEKQAEAIRDVLTACEIVIANDHGYAYHACPMCNIEVNLTNLKMGTGEVVHKDDCQYAEVMRWFGLLPNGDPFREA